MNTQASTSSFPLRIALALGAITLVGPSSIDMYLPALPAMADDLSAEYATLQLTLTVFLIAMGAGQLIFGPVIDAYGRRRPLGLALMVFFASSLVAAASPTVEILLLTRVLQGLAAALALVTAMSSVRDVAEGVAAAQVFAMLMTIQGLAPVVAPAVGGVIGDTFGWRAIFLTLGCLAAAVFINNLMSLPETLEEDKRVPLKLSSALRTYTEILRDRRFLLAGLALATAFSFLFAYIGGSSYTYQVRYDVSPSMFGFIFGGTGLAILIGAVSTAKLVTVFRLEKIAFIAVSATLAGAIVGLASVVANVGLSGIVVGMFIALLGLGMAEATLTSIALSTRTTALGASAAVLGALPLLLGAVVIPVAALIAETGALYWLLFLAVLGALATFLTFQCIQLIIREGFSVTRTH